jgi:hypothetical protein
MVGFGSGCGVEGAAAGAAAGATPFNLCFRYSYEASSLRRDFTRRLKERPTQFFDRTYLKLFAYCLLIPNLLEKSIGPMQKTGGFFAYDVSSRII